MAQCARSRVKRLRRGSYAVLCAALFSTSGAVAPAVAHDVVVDAQPPAGGTVEEFPREIVLEFSGYPRDTFNMFAVTDKSSGEILFDGTPKLDGRNLTIDVPADVNPGAGTYTVGFQITSSDGHATRGKTEFRVAGESAPPENQPVSPDDKTERDSGLNPVVLALIAFGAFAALVAVLIMVRVKSRRIEEL